MPSNLKECCSLRLFTNLQASLHSHPSLKAPFPAAGGGKLTHPPAMLLGLVKTALPSCALTARLHVGVLFGRIRR